MYNELVSVVIPTISSRKKLLRKAIKSIENQTYKNIEIIIETEGNACESRNNGIKRSKGHFIAFLDDDDTWEPTKIEKQMRIMEEYPDCPLVTCYSLDTRFGQSRVDKPPLISTQQMILNAFSYSSTSTYLIRRYPLDMISNNNEYFDASLPSAQEYELAIRLSKYHNARCVPEVLVQQNSVQGQISENWVKKRSGIKQVYRKHKEIFNQASSLNRIKLFGVVCLFYIAHLFGNRIYKIIIPFKKKHEVAQ